MTHLLNALHANHQLLKQHIQPGNTVIDATMGNGHDTLFLAQLVGQSGVVHAFDIQESAIIATQSKLESANAHLQCQLHHIGHECIDNILSPNEMIHAATFNLGYLPRADKNITTLPHTTLKALVSVLNRLVQHGIVTLVVYDGHDNGKVEKETLINFLTILNQQQFTVMTYAALNQQNNPPMLIMIQKRDANMPPIAYATH
ncbi:class I SAM-dependent methyltransferase [Carnobacteriaceae bacterium zg-C25]|nr:class I SAM-dependent methyltransferase [Carnobacteriaceae bacterium zg-C25]